MANSIKKSNELAKSMCASGTKYRYLYGGKGQEYTTALVKRLAAQYPSYYGNLQLALADADKGYYAIDCSGFVCKVLGISNASSSMMKSDAVAVLSVSKENAKPGMALWKQGHIAYVGEDLKIYEAAGTAEDLKVSTWSKRSGGFTKLLIVKNSALAEEYLNEKPKPSKVTYFKKYTGSATGIDEIFKAIGADKYYDKKAATSYAKRRPIARVNGYPYDQYCGNADQNIRLRKLAREGNLVKPN